MANRLSCVQSSALKGSSMADVDFDGQV